MSIASENRNEPSSKIYVTPGRLSCQVPGKAGIGRAGEGGGVSGGSSHPRWTAGWAGFLERACPLGLGLLSAGAHVYPGRAGRTWLLSLVLGNLDSCPWTATKTLPSRPRRRAEHVASVRMLQVSGLVFLVFPARPASVTLHYCHLPFRSLHHDSFLNK